VKSSPAFQVRSGSSSVLPPPALQISTNTTDKPSNLPPRLLAHFAKQGGRPEMFAQAFANAKQSMDETFAQYPCEPAMMTPIGTPSEEDADSPLMFSRQPQNTTRPARPSLLIAPTPSTAGVAPSTVHNAPSPSTTCSTSSISHANSPHLLPGLVSDHEGEEEDDNDDHSHLDDHDHEDDDVVMVDSVVDLDSHFASAVQHSDHENHHHHHQRQCHAAADEEQSDGDEDVVVVARKAGKN
jgi:hypothetical protein